MEQNRNSYDNLALYEQDIPALGPFKASDISRGICRYLRNLGYSPLTEFKLKSKRRVDVIGLNKGGTFVIIEIKSSVNVPIGYTPLSGLYAPTTGGAMPVL